MLFHYLEGTNVGVDIEQFVGTLAEEVHLEDMRSAWQRIADRHPIMRTRFRWMDRDEPEQEVVAGVEVPLTVHDLRDLAGPAQADRVAEHLFADRRAGFSMDAAPLWRLTLFLLGPARQQLVFTYHHALLDTSVVWITEEALRSYDAIRHGEVAELIERRPYREHIEWLHEHLNADRVAAQAYYAELLEGFDAPTRLGALEHADGRPPATTPADGYGSVRFRLPPDVSDRFHDLVASGASPARRSSRLRGHLYWPHSREPSTWSSVRPAGAAARACPGARTSWGC